MKDEYREPESEETADLKVKGSRFIGRIMRVLSQDEADEKLRALRKAEYDATHHCSAWRIGPEGALTRFNDDGEPNGSAGMPILRRIEAADLTNAMVVVTRYYGGTKLGTGGLVRAYGDTAGLVVDAVRVRTCVIRLPVAVTFDYDDTSPAMHTVNQFDAVIARSEYGDRTTLYLEVRRSEAEAFEAAFVEALSGRGEVVAGQVDP